MHRTKASRVLVPSALAAAILFGAAGPASAETGERPAAERAAAAGPIDDLVNGILEAIKGLLPPGVSLPPISIPEIKLPEIKLPDLNIPGVNLPQIPGVQLPQLPPLTPPQLPATPNEITPEVTIPEIPDIPDVPDVPGRKS
ncbi:hypothetical protein [Streptomyces antimicrobicus]|uniref:Secreted protein n=1 Tax=Streptomyces antimicrobicus TaxID=2883108 RepID=A0ABS8BF76_9ACTN|nr:hypothetical protein [Streptomyces antimicrobicus]MCB5183265.1 hypothetical protein [Streptomyces antimicrobicus]